jgi:hypothetical protein
MQFISKLDRPDVSNGFYLFKDKAYTDRIDIFERMKKENDYHSPIRFYFHDHVFKKFDWTVEPDVSLQSLYKLRAQQIREEYDYIILSFSGGSDSLEILHVFMENDIFLDEVQILHFEKAISKLDFQDVVNDPDLGYFAEYQLSALPALAQLRLKSPNTKINSIDISDRFMEEAAKGGFRREQTSTRTALINSPTVLHTSLHINNELFNETTLTKKSRVALIVGNDKPVTRIRDNKMYFFFTDVCYYNTKLMNTKEVDKIYYVEEFFWSPKAPLIPIKQTHVIKRVIETDADFRTRYFQVQDENKQFLKGRRKGIDIRFEREQGKYIYAHWNGLSLPKSGPSRPEAKLAQVLTGKTFLMDSVNEQNVHTLKKYQNVPYRYLNGILGTELYYVGDLKVLDN